MTLHQPISPAEARRLLAQRMLRGEAAAADGVPPITPRDPAARVPLTTEQSQLWLHAAMAPTMPLYNESITIHRYGAYDHAAIEAALSEFVRRHAIWRTAFVESDGDVVQQVAPPMAIAVPLVDISHLPAAARDAEAVRLATADARAPIALDRAPLFRARAVRLAPDNHRIYLTLHHIIFDGVSIYRTLVPELAALFDAFAKGAPSPFPEPAIGYADYAVWQVQHADAGEQARQIAYWRDTLAEPLPRLDLAGDRARPAHATHAGSMATFTLPRDLIEAAKALARARGATLYMVLLAAYKALLFRYTGDQDIIVGGVTDTRRRPELQPLVGYFLNTMALRSRPRGDLAFADYLDAVRAAVIGAIGAADVPFNRLIRALDIKRGAGTHPLFNTLFSIEPPVEPFPPGWDLTQMDVTVGAAKYDLYLELDERHEAHGGGMAGRFLYSTELFDAATIDRLIDHWTRLLRGALADPLTPLAQLPLLGDHDRHMLDAGANGPALALPHPDVASWFAESAAARPQATALVMGDVRWTYADLSRRADAIAAAVQAAGVRRGDLVGFALMRGPDMVAAMLGILRAGAAYLPLDPGFPPARLGLIATDAGLALALCEPAADAAVRAALIGAGVTLMALPDDQVQAVPVAVPVDGEDLAYVLYTSGSTGRPKGVEVPHAALVNLLLAMRAQPGFAEGQRLLAITTLSFDIAGLELWLPLVCGGTVHLAPREVAIDMAALAAMIDQVAPDVLQATPATWLGLIESGWAGAPAMRALCGGEALPRVLAEQLLGRVAELWNVYGPTETTIWSTCARVEHGTGPVSIGRPIANTVVRVLDQDGRDRPIGAVGELWIGGRGLARGYRGQPDLTAQRFVVIDGARLYRTGDLARWRADGQLECLGRVDAEEKIRGFRVAVEEIEGALMRLPGIAAAAVRAWPDASGERALAAYVVAEGGDPADWMAALGETLPDYMIPRRYVRLGALPQTPNGKIDRRALPEPGAPLARSGEPPATPDEVRLAALWCRVLELPAVCRDDDFFALGGHSLLIARLLRLAEVEYGQRVPMAALFRAPRLADMAVLLASGRALDAPALVPIQPLGSQVPLFWLDGGSTMLPLARELGEDQPFFGLSVDGLLEALGRCPPRLEDIAALVVEELVRLRPQGPFRLGGWCSSGIVAYAVAAQLQARGRAVDLLIMAHAFHPVRARAIGPLRFQLSRVRFHLAQTLRQPRGRRWRYFVERLRGLSDSAGLVGGREAVLRPALIDAINRAALHYVPPRYQGRVLLVQPAEHPDVLDFEADWRAGVTGRFVMHTAAGGHRTMLEYPHVGPLAKVVAAALADGGHGDAQR